MSIVSRPDDIPLDVKACAIRGYKRQEEELPALSLYGWALNYLEAEPDEWDESVIHLSDYRHTLEPDDGACKRQLWHRLRGDDKRPPTLWERVMWDQGFAMQMRFSWLITKGLPDDWELHDIEMDVSLGLPSNDTGSCDLVLKSKKRRRMLGIEFKTQRGRAFHYMNEAKPSHMLQAQAELYALHTIHGGGGRYTVGQVIMYLDREGQNEPRVFPVPFDSSVAKRVEEASKEVNKLAEEVMPFDSPSPLEPQIKVRENKGPNSIYLEEPWMCSYCSFKGESCPGSMDDDLIGNGIVAKGDHEGDFDLKVDDEEKARRVESAVRRAVSAGNVKLK